jgi:plasmid stability protein
MEQEVRTILTNTVENEQLARQRAALKKLAALRKKIFGDKILSDSTPLIRTMRHKRSRQTASW